MKDRTTLLAELDTAQALFDHIITNRKKKILIRWIIGILFYASLWQYAWIRTLFWIGLVLELLLLAFTLSAYFKLRAKIKRLHLELNL